MPLHQVERMNLASKKTLSREQSKDLDNYLKQNFLFTEIPHFETLKIVGENVLAKEYKYASSVPSSTRILVRKSEVNNQDED